MVVPECDQGRSEFLEKTEGNVAIPEADAGQRKVNLVEDGGDFLPRSAPDGHAPELGVQREVPLVHWPFENPVLDAVTDGDSDGRTPLRFVGSGVPSWR